MELSVPYKCSSPTLVSCLKQTFSGITNTNLNGFFYEFFFFLEYNKSIVVKMNENDQYKDNC